MFSVGKNITAPNDPLIRIDMEKLASIISGRTGNLAPAIEQLRTIYTLDAKKYASLKLGLPYMVCGLFNPPYRKIANFSRTETFILDFDHLAGKELDPVALKQKLIPDGRVTMAFVSPGGDGLKVLFRLSEPCYDAHLYSIFYKLFARRFAMDCNIEQVLDPRTSDVARACFLSHDPELYYNPEAEPIDMSLFVNPDNLHETRKIEAEVKKLEREESGAVEKVTMQLPMPLLKEIREKLNPNIKLREEKNIIVPAEINLVMQRVTDALAEYGISLVSAENIHYGRKLRVVLGQVWAELNLFYGKKGFSVVKTPKRGSNEDLADIAHRIVCMVVIDQN